MSSSGYTYDGPAGKIGFAPRITPDKFRCFFSGAEAWGTFSQRFSATEQQETIEVKWGRLSLKTLALELPDGKKAKRVIAAVGGKDVRSTFSQEGKRVQIELAGRSAINVGNQMKIRVEI